jgi:hypothetical protein
VQGDVVYRDEFNYLHFQKRPMQLNFEEIPNSFYLTRDGAIKKESGILPCRKMIEKYNKSRCLHEFKKKLDYQKYIWKRRMVKYIFGH